MVISGSWLAHLGGEAVGAGSDLAGQAAVRKVVDVLADRPPCPKDVGDAGHDRKRAMH